MRWQWKFWRNWRNHRVRSGQEEVGDDAVDVGGRHVLAAQRGDDAAVVVVVVVVLVGRGRRRPLAFQLFQLSDADVGQVAGGVDGAARRLFETLPDAEAEPGGQRRREHGQPRRVLEEAPVVRHHGRQVLVPDALVQPDAAAEHDAHHTLVHHPPHTIRTQ